MLELAMPLTEADIQPALPLWAGLIGARVRLINHSENQTFLVQADAGQRYCLRVHRPGYQSRAAIESELAWLAALGRDTSLPVPKLVPGQNGEALQSFETPKGDARLAVLFHFVNGIEPTLQSDLPKLFVILGRYAATLHQHARRWAPPSCFERPVWTAANILAPDGLWGDWRSAPGVDTPCRSLLERLTEALTADLTLYGTSSTRFGLIHADMRLGNLLLDKQHLNLIDFDDCGFGWFAYDFAAAISFHETSPLVPALKSAWLEGYRPIRALEAADIEAMETMVMLRRMALLAWIGSHAETALAQAHMEGFAEGTAQLAARYLGGRL
jgi:Ser/Thr protein kinase RdoA (MazF antagonist)